jgi:transposase-like protein
MALVGRNRHCARMRRRYTGKQRSQLVELVTGGHATVHEAAAKLGVVPATAHYWLKRGRADVRSTQARRRGTRVAGQGTATTFVRLVPGVAVGGTIAVRVGGAEVQVRQGFNGDLLRAVVAALQEGAP